MREPGVSTAARRSSSRKRAARMAPSKMGYPPGTMVTVDDALKMLRGAIGQRHRCGACRGRVGLGRGLCRRDERQFPRARHAPEPLGQSQRPARPRPDLLGARHGDPGARHPRRVSGNMPDLFQIQAIQSGKRVIRTHNALVYRYPGADGMKTGFICASGFNVVATASRERPQADHRGDGRALRPRAHRPSRPTCSRPISSPAAAASSPRLVARPRSPIPPIPARPTFATSPAAARRAVRARRRPRTRPR